MLLMQSTNTDVAIQPKLLLGENCLPIWATFSFYKRNQLPFFLIRAAVGSCSSVVPSKLLLVKSRTVVSFYVIDWCCCCFFLFKDFDNMKWKRKSICVDSCESRSQSKSSKHRETVMIWIVKAEEGQKKQQIELCYWIGNSCWI